MGQVASCRSPICSVPASVEFISAGHATGSYWHFCLLVVLLWKARSWQVPLVVTRQHPKSSIPKRTFRIENETCYRKMVSESKVLKFFDPYLSTDSLRVFRSVASKVSGPLNQACLLLFFCSAVSFIALTDQLD
jgi:hypothetical protein